MGLCFLIVLVEFDVFDMFLKCLFDGHDFGEECFIHSSGKNCLFWDQWRSHWAQLRICWKACEGVPITRHCWRSNEGVLQAVKAHVRRRLVSPKSLRAKSASLKMAISNAPFQEKRQCSPLHAKLWIFLAVGLWDRANPRRARRGFLRPWHVIWLPWDWVAPRSRPLLHWLCLCIVRMGTWPYLPKTSSICWSSIGDLSPHFGSIS